MCIEEGCERTAGKARTQRCPSHWRQNLNTKRLAAGDLCKIDECGRPRFDATGFCRPHARQWRQHGEIVSVATRRVHPIEERDGLRRCRTCRQWKEPGKFIRQRSSECRRCLELPVRYGITFDQFELLFATQGSVCAICGTDAPGGKWQQWAIDHDHGCCSKTPACGRCVRGILCNNCNMGIGYFADSADRLTKAATYAARRLADDVEEGQAVTVG
jgi:hypothetical protein